MSKFRYFVLSGKALNLYLESEKLEFEQKQRQNRRAELLAELEALDEKP